MHEILFYKFWEILHVILENHFLRICFRIYLRIILFAKLVFIWEHQELENENIKEFKTNLTLLCFTFVKKASTLRVTGLIRSCLISSFPLAPEIKLKKNENKLIYLLLGLGWKKHYLIYYYGIILLVLRKAVSPSK